MKKRLCAAVLAFVLAVSTGIAVFADDDNTPKGIRISPTSMLMDVGQYRQITATVTPSGAFDAVTWRSDNTRVADVSDGTVEALAAGTANIYATTSNGISTVCRVTVRGNEVETTKMEMSLSKMTVRVDQTRQLWVLFTPSYTTEKNVDWTTSDKDVATVDITGVVTGVGPGTATITAKAASGTTATCEVTVPGKVVSGLSKDVTTTTDDIVTSGEKLGSSEAAATVREAAASTKKSEIGQASFKNKTSVSQTAISAAAFAAKEQNRNIHLRFITTNDEGKTRGTFVFDPAAVTDRTADLKTSVYVDSKKVATTKNRFNKYYKNDVAVLEIAQGGKLGFTAQIAAKVDLDELITTNLFFYTYDVENNSYNPLTVGNPRVDKNGYLRFSTDTGGVIVVSDTQLKAK